MSKRASGDVLIWPLVFVALGLMIVVNLPPENHNPGWFFLVGGLSLLAAVAVVVLEVVRRGR